MSWVQLTWQKLYLVKPKGSFWWKAIFRLADNCFTLASCPVNDDATISFWNDTWNLCVLNWKYAELYSYAVRAFIQADIENMLCFPLSTTASNQSGWITRSIQLFNLNMEETNVWSYIWGSQAFLVKNAYLKLIGSNVTSPYFKWMWKSYCKSWLKFFFRLMLRDRINTRTLLRKKNRYLDSYDCALCNAVVQENRLHLLFECSFSQWCWRFLNINWNSQL